MGDRRAAVSPVALRLPGRQESGGFPGGVVLTGGQESGGFPGGVVLTGATGERWFLATE
ncbi:hypothetical protein [Raoultella ornithinolytica]|uniref:hypothetical protein n=1 Tax=Raoultella ornithinolytica TaxID=54291 RepID=UPI001A25313C|nr:hypothetical protein [Raoultella ornithinolytica]MCZ0879165.1 hypothetical protein [Raoultella ornithinolytica]HAT3643334.1 hypothetical protein [Raoultella ornithinolytica]HAT3647189.1 hypothetical protein [Raoultella ornithinolytica]